MRVFLRHTRTRYYYRGAYEWVTEQGYATDFGTIERSLQVIIHDHLDGMSLVICYDERGPEQIFDLATDAPRSAGAQARK